jgi:pimeloyl-ACP methyl ester carboxylesterase
MNPSLESFKSWESRATTGPTLRGRRSGGSRPLLHFLSGNGFCGGVYWPLLNRLHAAGYGLFLHDIEGQGASDAAACYSGSGPLLARIPRVMKEQGLCDGRPLIGIGHSFGGALTLRVAAEQPQLFRALVLLDPITLPTPAWLMMKTLSALGRNPMAMAARRRRERWPSRAAAAEHLRGRGIYKGWTDEAFDCFIEHATRADAGEWRLCCPKELEAQIFERPLYCWHALPKLQVPVLFLRGAQSYGFFARAEKLAARANSRVEIAQLPGGHCFMQENPAAAAQAVSEFLHRHGL